MARESWETIAHRLAERLMYHANCENGWEELDENCAFCRDIIAYRAYVAKCKQTRRTAMQTSMFFSNAPLVSLDEIRREHLD